MDAEKYIAKKTMRGAQPAATAPAVTTDEVLPVIPMSVGHRLQAQDAIVLRRREAFRTSRKRKRSAGSKSKPKAKRRKAQHCKLGNDQVINVGD